MILQFIIVWLVFWFIVVITLSFKYTIDGWFSRYICFIFSPLVLIALLISAEIVRRLNGKEKSFKSIFLYFIDLIAKGKDDPI